MTPILASLLLAAAVGASAAPSAGGKKVERQEKPAVVDASYEVFMPSGWAIERRAGGAVFTGPSADGVAALISVRFVRPDHPQYATPEEYMKRLTRPSSIPVKGWKDGPVEKAAVAGRKALRVERDTTEFSAPRTMSPKEVPMREEHVAVSAAKGFYLLVYTAPASIDKVQRPVFRALVEKGFKPKL